MNANQIRLLRILCKFRFVSTDLLADELSKDRSSIYESLYILTSQGYVAKRYDKTYRLRGKPASYFLAAKGIKYLRDNSNASHTVLSNMYKSKNVSEQHVDHCLSVLAVYSAIRKQTKEAFNIFSRYELGEAEFFPRPLPDLYLGRKKPKEGRQLDYMLDIFDPQLPFWVIKKRIRAYQDHCYEAELGEGQTYPNILLVASSDRTEQRLLGIIENMLEDFELYTTTIERMLSPKNKDQAVWKEVFEEGYCLI